MFYSAKYILCQSFHAPMMENTAEFENIVNGVSLVKVWSFLTNAASNQFVAFHVFDTATQQNMTKAVDRIPATSVCSKYKEPFSQSVHFVARIISH